MTYQYLDHAPVIIANGQSLSGVVQIAGKLLVGIIMPAAWDAANLTFQVSRDDVTYNNKYDDAGVEKTITAAAARHIDVVPAEFSGSEWLKIRSGTSGTPVPQTAARTIYLVLRSA